MREKWMVSSSPHIRHIDTTRGIMADVIIALCPAAVYGCILFGWRALLLLGCTILSAVAAEYIWCRIVKKENSIGDLSAIVTGLLLGMNLPPHLPIWMGMIGSVAAIIVVKQMFGGLGQNFANPAIAARIVLLVSFPSAMTSFCEPALRASEKIITSATPLAAENPPALKELFFGMHSGCIGETSSFLLIIGGLYLLIRRVISPIIPCCFLGTVAIFSLIFAENLPLSLFGGGLILGAIFMATDYSTSPSTKLGKVIFGIGCGIITFCIRKWANLPEGVSYSILLMNILVPHINTLTRRRPFGAEKAVAENE